MRKKHEVESGAVLVLVAICMSLFFILLAVAIDIGYMHATKAELQHAADAAALAGAIELAEAAPDPVGRAQEYGGYNEAAKVALTEMPESDVIVGYMENPLDIHAEIDTESEDDPNSVEAVTRRTTDVNGPLQLFLGAFTGLDEVNIAAKGRAVYTRQVVMLPDSPPGGEEGSIPNLIPFSISRDYWEELKTSTVDNYNYVEFGNVQPGKDGIGEVDAYPHDVTAGNFGTVDIGNPNNSVPDIRDQITGGVDESDYEQSFGKDGALWKALFEDKSIESIPLEADTGISAGFEAALKSIIGQPKVILVHEAAESVGNNTIYHITGMECIVIVDVNLHKNPKYVYIQMCDGCCNPGLPGTGGTTLFLPDMPPSDTLYMTGLTR
ncbi:MAG TPA: pilus assembly protein TadG-related protein [bacterium]|nr:pilus assembly protein TadG-related protein [bacterium]